MSEGRTSLSSVELQMLVIHPTSISLANTSTQLITTFYLQMGYTTLTHPHLMSIVWREVNRAAFNRVVHNSPLNEGEILQRVINEFYGEVISRPGSATGANSETPRLWRWGNQGGNA